MGGDFIYPAIIDRGSDGSFIVSFPDFPEALTFGHTEAEAADEAVDCLREALRGRIRDDEDIPTRVALAGRLNVDESEVRRILDPAHRTKLDRLEQAAKALGGRLEITFVPLA